MRINTLRRKSIAHAPLTAGDGRRGSNIASLNDKIINPHRSLVTTHNANATHRDVIATLRNAIAKH